jgi:hypothetical protein
MFSKFGKVLSYQFHILLSKDEILSNSKTKTKKRRKFIKPEKDSLSTRDNDNSSATPELKPPSHIFRSQSRDDFYKTIGKPQGPPVGYYNCNYSCVTKSPKSAVFKKRKKTVSRIRTPVNDAPHFLTHVDRPKTPGVDFKKQLPRNNIFIAQLNENRFVSFKNMPEVCSNFRRAGTPDIGKVSARPNVLINSSISLNSYNVDFRFVKEDLGKVIDFNKCSPRKPLFEGKKDLRSYEIKWNCIDKKKSVIDFNKTCQSPKPS